MLCKSNKNEVLKSLKNGNLLNIIPLIPSIADDILIDSDKKYHSIDLFNQVFPNKCKHSDAMLPSAYLTLGVVSMLNNFHALSSFPIATSSPYILEKLNLLVSPHKEKPLFDEKNVRNFYKKYQDEEFQTYTNKYLGELFSHTNIRHMNTYSYDCSEIPVCFNNANYEKSEVITGKHDKPIRGYKLGILRGILPHDESYPCEIRFGSLKEHDLAFSSKFLMETQWLKNGDVLLIDRGFIDHCLLRALNEKGITLIIPAKKNMEIYQNAVEIAQLEKKWIAHPNKKRKDQKIQLVEQLEENWQGNEKKEEGYKKELKLTAAVIRYDLKKEDETDNSDKIVSKDKKYAYSVFISTNPSLKAREIISLYEKRWGSEEDFRQLKDYWKINKFTTTRYEGIQLELICCVVAYALYELFKLTAKGKKLRHHCLMKYYQDIETKWEKARDAKYVILVQGYYGIFGLLEILELYKHADEKICNIIQKVVNH